jgi:hypothetical protein
VIHHLLVAEDSSMLCADFSTQASGLPLELLEGRLQGEDAGVIAERLRAMMGDAK